MEEQNFILDNKKEEIDEVNLNEELYNEYYSSQSEWEKQATLDRDFYNGNQWTEKAKKELQKLKQFPIVINVIKPTVEQAKALLTTNKPRFSSTGREDSDTKTGKVFSDLLTYIWDISYGGVQLKKCVEDYYVEGRGIGLAYYNPQADFGKGEIFWKSINPKDVYPDPNSKDIFWRDAANVVIADVLTKEQAEKEYNNIDFSTLQQDDGARHSSYRSSITNQNIIDEVNDQYHKKYLRIDRYTKIQEIEAHAIDTNGKEHVMDEREFQEWVNQPVAIVTTIQSQNILLEEKAKELLSLTQQLKSNVFHYVQLVDPNTGQPGQPQPVAGAEQGSQGEIPNSTTEVKELIIANLISEGIIVVENVKIDKIYRVLSLGKKLIYKGIMPLSEYPFFILPNHWNRNPYPMSDVRHVRPLQEYINKIRSLIVAHTSNSVNTKWWLPRGSINRKDLEEGMNRAGTYIGEYDAELGVPVQASPSPLPNELYHNEEKARADIQEILGIYPLMQGDNSNAPATYKGTMALDEFGQRRIKSKKDDIESALNHFCKVIIEMIQAYYTEYKAVRLIQPDSSVITTQINMPIFDDYSNMIKGRLNDVTIGKYDVVVVSGSMLPSNRWAQFEYYVEMFKMGLIDQVEVLKKTEIVDTEGVLQRFSEINTLKQQVEQLTQQLKQISGDKQTTDRENLHLKQKTEVEKFKSSLKNSQNRAELATQLYSSRLSDELNNSKQQNKYREKK